jgi:hypothetical protein
VPELSLQKPISMRRRLYGISRIMPLRHVFILPCPVVASEKVS